MKKRTRGRELALQFLYQLDLLGEEVLGTLSEFLRSEERDAETCRYARKIVEGAYEHRIGIDSAERQTEYSNQQNSAQQENTT